MSITWLHARSLSFYTVILIFLFIFKTDSWLLYMCITVNAYAANNEVQNVWRMALLYIYKWWFKRFEKKKIVVETICIFNSMRCGFYQTNYKRNKHYCITGISFDKWYVSASIASNLNVYCQCTSFNRLKSGNNEYVLFAFIHSVLRWKSCFYITHFVLVHVHMHTLVWFVRHTFGISFRKKPMRWSYFWSFDHRNWKQIDQSKRFNHCAFKWFYSASSNRSPKAIHASEIAFIMVNVWKEQCTTCVCVERSYSQFNHIDLIQGPHHLSHTQ